MLILLEPLVTRHFLTLAAQLQQAGVGISGLLSMLVETLILVGMILYLSSVMPEGEKSWGLPVVIGGIICPPRME